ncbi:MAG: metallophosphoesterase, partial [Actinomycetes bacterium]
MRIPLSRITISAGAVLAGVAMFAALAVPASAAGAKGKACRHDAQSWSFGVMADTQWIGADDGKNPNSVAVDIIRQLNAQFIKQHVKFVVQAGDLVDSQSTASLDTTAAFRQELYNAGIGFYPLRGNHEASAAAATEFLRVFPQTQTATMGSTPADALAVLNPDAATQPVPAASGAPFQAGTISTSPAAPAGFGGLCYAVDYKNARIVLLDQFTPTTGASHSTLDSAQVDWMNAQLSGRPAG